MGANLGAVIRCCLMSATAAVLLAAVNLCSATMLRSSTFETAAAYTGLWSTKLSGSRQDSALSGWIHSQLDSIDGLQPQYQQYTIGPLFLPRSCTVVTGDRQFECHPVQPAPCRNNTLLKLTTTQLAFQQVSAETLNYELT